jgi:ABC-2 type transport system permease protein
MRSFKAQLVRELSAYFNSSLAYIVMTVYLAVAGVVFTINLWHASAFARPANYGATLNYLSFFAMLLSSFITMRLFAEEKSRGTIEVLLTSPISDVQVVLAKYLGALGFFLSLKLPTLILVALLGKYATVDWGTILLSYAGIVMLAAAFMAIGMFISALSSSQMVAGIVSVLVSLLFITVYVVGELIRDNESVWKQVFLHLSFNDQAASFMMGIFDSRPVVFFGSFILLFFTATAGALGARRWRDRRVALPVYLLTLALLAANLAVVYLISKDHFVRADLTSTRKWELDPRTIQVLRKLKQDIYVTAYPLEVAPQMQQDPTLPPAWQKFRQFMSECRKYTDRLRWQELQSTDVGVAQELQKIFKSAVGYNTIFLYTSKREDGPRKSIAIRELYEGNSQTGQLLKWHAEPRLLQAINEMVERPRVAVYCTGGHREIGIRDTKEFGANYLANKLYLLENVEFLPINLSGVRRVPSDCQVLFILGPKEPFGAEEVQVLEEYLNRGGAVFLTIEAGSNTGLKELMAKWGVDLDGRQVRQRGQRPGVVVPQVRPHKINEGFDNFSFAMFAPCVVKPVEGRVDPGVDVVPLAVGGPDSEALNTNPPGWEAGYSPEGHCLAVAVAALDESQKRVKTRIVVWGTTANLWNQQAATFPFLVDYFLNTFKWVSAKEEEMTAPAKVEEPPVRLSERDGWIVAGVSVALLPLLGVALGTLTWFVRRK